MEEISKSIKKCVSVRSLVKFHGLVHGFGKLYRTYVLDLIPKLTWCLVRIATSGIHTPAAGLPPASLSRAAHAVSTATSCLPAWRAHALAARDVAQTTQSPGTPSGSPTAPVEKSQESQDAQDDPEREEVRQRVLLYRGTWNVIETVGCDRHLR